MFGERAHVRMASDDMRAAGALRDRLEAEGLRVASIRPIATSLEDVFIARLGHAAGAAS
jgi:hypothetical protein